MTSLFKYSFNTFNNMQSSINSGEFTLSDVLIFLRNPAYTESNKFGTYSNLRYLAWSYLFSFLGVIIVTLAMFLIDKLIVNYFETASVYSQFRESSRNIKTSFGGHKFLIVAVIGPLLEEIIFRLPLNAKKYSVALAVAILVFRLSGNSFVNFYFTKSSLIGLSCSCLAFMLINRYLSSSWLENIREKHFYLWFYAVVIIFGLVHIDNISNIKYNLLLIYPIFVMPQMLIGVFIGNLRVQRGFFWGFLLHVLINSTSLFLSS